jgi:hypothetical protein
MPNVNARFAPSIHRSKHKESYCAKCSKAKTSSRMRRLQAGERQRFLGTPYRPINARFAPSIDRSKHRESFCAKCSKASTTSRRTFKCEDFQAGDRQRFVGTYCGRVVVSSNLAGGRGTVVSYGILRTYRGDSQTHVRYYYYRYHFLCCAAGRVKTAQWRRGCGQRQWQRPHSW